MAPVRTAQGKAGGHPTPPVVLLVDDEPMLLEAITEQLRGSFTFFTAGNTAEAERLVHSRPFDVVICDQNLPGELGLDFLARLKESHPGVKRMLITGYSNPEFIGSGLEAAGLDACLVKPVRASDVAAAVRKATS